MRKLRNADRDVHYDYSHALGLQTKARFDGLDGEGVTTYYDAFGQRTTVLLNMGGQARYVSYDHDAAGNLVRLTHPDGAAFGYGHDPLGRTTLVHDHAGVGHIDDYVVRYWYKPEGPRHAAVRGAGSMGFSTAVYYDPLHRPTAIINDLPVAGPDPMIGLSYNPAGQIVSRELYNDAYAAPPAYNVNRAYGVNGLNQYTAAGPASFAYDANGNLTSDGTRSYVYDVENRLVSASGQTNASLVYDPLGRLVQVSGAPHDQGTRSACRARESLRLSDSSQGRGRTGRDFRVAGPRSFRAAERSAPALRRVTAGATHDNAA